ncbi:MAG: methyl-accepting chemotaxis protein [Spirochaetaceae bacterium]|jgi:methyl-accepting chemotaxis protein|nr:methyl-accepting chemotaxis protein [Spirochaetaceae bacterium]
MKLTYRISLLTGILVLAVAGSTGVTSLILASRALTKSAGETLRSQAISGAEFLSASIHGKRDVLMEVASRKILRDMNFDTQKADLNDEIEDLGYQDMLIVGRDGVSRSIKTDLYFDLSDQTYVQDVLAGKTSVSDVIISRITGKPTVMFGAPITAEGGRVVGGLLGHVDARYLSNLAAVVKAGKTSFSILIDEVGMTIAHRDYSYVENQTNPGREGAKNPAFASLAKAYNIILAQDTGIASYTYQGAEKLIGFATIPDYKWSLLVTIDKSEFMAPVYAITTTLGVILVICLAVGMVLAILIARSVTKPLAGVSKTLKVIAAGDLRPRIGLHSKDELGELASSVNGTMESITGLIRTIKDQSAVLADVGRDLSADTTETAAAMNQITSNIENIQDRTVNQNEGVSHAKSAMEQITGNITALNGHVESQTEAVSVSSANIEEMLASIQSVTGALNKNSESMKLLTDAAAVGQAGIQEVATDIQEIARESAGLLEINAVMENIAGQTNLLSMNAAIEAAHSGEAGKGFAVVADEIRKLAETSSEQSKTIGAVLKKIKESIDKIGASTDSVLTKFAAIDEGIKSVSGQTANIQTAMEEQNAGSRNILEAIGRVKAITGQVSAGTSDMRESSAKVFKEAENLEIATQEISGGMKEMAIGAAQVNTAITHVNELSGKNKESIDVLIREIERFTVA